MARFGDADAVHALLGLNPDSPNSSLPSSPGSTSPVSTPVEFVPLYAPPPGVQLPPHIAYEAARRARLTSDASLAAALQCPMGRFGAELGRAVSTAQHLGAAHGLCFAPTPSAPHLLGQGIYDHALAAQQRQALAPQRPAQQRPAQPPRPTWTSLQPQERATTPSDAPRKTIGKRRAPEGRKFSWVELQGPESGLDTSLKKVRGHAHLRWKPL